MDRQPVRYARSGDVNVAYQVVGRGPLDVVLVPGFISHLDLDWDEPRQAAPQKRRQIEQWQWQQPRVGSVTSNCTAPQRQAPFTVSAIGSLLG